ncbi:MAG: nucleotide sugar dehydrogenase, partial [Chloroflexota bacterium]
MARIAVIGLWHLGCVVSAGLAHLRHKVAAMDFDPAVVHRLQQGVPPVFEPGLAELIGQQVLAGVLSFHLRAEEVLAGAEYVLITFDTPVDENDQSDLAPLYAAVDAIAAQASGPVHVVVMSQVPVGTCQRLAERLRALAPRLRFALLCQPENLRLGEALRAFLQPVVIVVGAADPAAAENLLRLYEGVDAPRLVMSWQSAEMAKHALNAFLATSVSFANELADLAAAAGADVRDVMRVLRLDRRIGPQAFLSPGPGFSGGTLARDVVA